ncbi:MAG: peptide chain release factor N(5)-glutamine methyltransferase [Flavobacteriales bacterium]|nr:peptide chain release factor N(5)-glutamine methyltransferase [Flavobacteriales bacterium]
MFVNSNRLTDLLPFFHKKLDRLYGERECRNIFLLICDYRFGLSKPQVFSGDYRLTESELLEINSMVKRLAKNEPIQHILGETEFYGQSIFVGPEVLIPRPETEELVDWIQKENQDQNQLRILDVGTGSGCIAIALKSIFKSKAEVVAVDISSDALEMAQKSALKNSCEIDFKRLDVLNDSLEILGEFDIIVSNPPYIPEADRTLMNSNVLDFEPEMALFVSNEDPLIFYQTIAKKALNQLSPQGKLYYEIHEDFGRQMVEMMELVGYSDITLLKDLQGKDRMLRASSKP